MSELIAVYLAPLFEELKDRRDYSDVLQTDIRRVPSNGNAKRLVILQCDSDGLELLSTFRRWWVADEKGLREPVNWPLPTGQIVDGIFNESPFVKFATDGLAVIFGAKLGEDWYCQVEGKLDIEGYVMKETLAVRFRSDLLS